MDKLKYMVFLSLILVIIQCPQAGAQDLVLRDKSITTPATYSANSITAGPDITLTGTGDLTLKAETIAVLPQFVILRGGKLSVVSYRVADLPDNTLVTNGDFFENLNGWDFYVMGTGNASWEVENRAFRVKINSGGTNVWDVSISQLGLTIENGKSYTVSFKARAASARDIQAYVALRTAPYTLYNSEYIFSLTTEWRQYTYTFTMTYPTDPSARIGFDFGTSDTDVYLDDVSLVEDPGSSVQVDITEEPNEYALDQNFPNPFNPFTRISYHLPQSCEVSLTVYDVLGREVAVLAQGIRDAGSHTVQFDGSNLSSELYVVVLKTDTYVQKRKMILLK